LAYSPQVFSSRVTATAIFVELSYCKDWRRKVLVRGVKIPLWFGLMIVRLWVRLLIGSLSSSYYLDGWLSAHK